jgi:hypothetical protein
MANLDLTTYDAEDILAGQDLPGRADLDGVIALTTFLRASGGLEPAPPMSAGLLDQLADPATGN